MYKSVTAAREAVAEARAGPVAEGHRRGTRARSATLNLPAWLVMAGEMSLAFP